MTPIIRIENARWLQFVEIQTAVLYFAKRLEGFRRKRVHLTIEMKPLRKKEHCRGMAHQNSERSYRIWLDSQIKPLAMLSCLAHEMIHVNQWLTGKMEDIRGGRMNVRWGTRVYHMPMKYIDHPWEIEAHRKDGKLAQSFVDFYTSGWRKK